MRTDALQEESRIVVKTDRFAAFVPYAACSPFHMWVVPRRHESSFLSATRQELIHLGLVLRRVLRKLYVGLHDPDYNYIIRSAPIKDVGRRYLHWYAAIIPRVTRSTGFELGTGVFINTSLPERSAEFLRSVDEDV
jgi:UDPglucose--hexose-1-phosphate uridylyltransferase